MKLCSLFDGSGGFPLAGSFYGIDPVLASEVEPYPIAVTRSRFPNMKHLGDVSKINGGEIEPCDVITFGSPCQDLSVAGKRAGLKHEGNGDDETTRSGLFMEAIRIIKEMREATHGRYPTFALWENVPGAFTSNNREDFRVVLEEFARVVDPSAEVPPIDKRGWPRADVLLGDGWSLAYRTMDAQFWGVPQRRRRLYLVADFRGERAGTVLFKREGLRGNPPEGGDEGENTSPDPEGGPGRTNGAGRAIALENHGNDSRVRIDTSGTIQTLTSRMGTGGGNVPLVMVERSTFSKKRHAQSATDFETWEPQDVTSTLNTFENSDIRATNLVVTGAPEYSIRRLTPLECCRLQGFPDGWGEIDHKESMTPEEVEFWREVRRTHAEIEGRTIKEWTADQILRWYNGLHTDAAEYKMWGNGIALPCARYVMEGIALELEKEGGRA